MKKLGFCFVLIGFLYSALLNASPKFFPHSQSAFQSAFPELNALTDADYQWIGAQIYQNEAASKAKYLTHWGKGEDFPSFGIAHFIWFPKNVTPPFEETFPAMVQFVSQTQLPPIWLLQRLNQGSEFDAPWQTKAQFDSVQSGVEMVELREWLLNSQALQARFVALEFEKRWFKEIAHLPKAEQADLNQRLKLMLSFKRGLFAVIDYFNFKGIGNNSKEQYQGQSWGLISVLKAMPQPNTNNQSTTEFGLLYDFIRAAKARLQLRTELAPVERKESRWLKGWFKRLDGYLKDDFVGC